MPLQIPDPVFGAWTKGFPAHAAGLRLSEVHGAGLRLSDLVTPVMTVHEEALTHNEDTVFGWAEERGVLLAPHGKTTMAPALWQRLLDAGAWGISVATPWQAEVAIDAGVSTVLIANAVTDLAAVRRLGALLADTRLRVLCWADSLGGVAILAEGMRDAARPLDVLVELGERAGVPARDPWRKGNGSPKRSPPPRDFGWPASRDTRDRSGRIAARAPSPPSTGICARSSSCTIGSCIPRASAPY
ncbi:MULTISPECIES: hypothetical protein [unclassified Microbacterium]|uniref:hypothetical protein n=1 Tax=unclassified Microbacterium TaxID=2609290 RepID=UPI001FCF2698|nr:MULTISPECIES: hypothetical protein [unclassified Microbacterium]